MRKQLTLVILALLGASFFVGGCMSAETTATPKEEEAFRNPPKEPPAEAVEGMKKGMQNAGGGNK